MFALPLLVEALACRNEPDKTGPTGSGTVCEVSVGLVRNAVALPAAGAVALMDQP
ncbi:MAG: hypothetical protein WBO45_20660 [Planctomycetota bacterium]